MLRLALLGLARGDIDGCMYALAREWVDTKYMQAQVVYFSMTIHMALSLRGRGQYASGLDIHGKCMYMK